MLLRSLSKHVPDQSGFAVALGFFIVVVGTFNLFACAPVQQRPPLYGESCLPFSGLAADIALVRTQFNDAIAGANLPAINALLAEDVILITGTDSTALIGRAAQLAIWAEDFSGVNDRLVYARTPRCITVSGIAPIAMERGLWLGAKTGTIVNTVGGDYSVKWRLTDGQWVIEAETYVTTDCAGNLCPSAPEAK